jgi:hypothetical protein
MSSTSYSEDEASHYQNEDKLYSNSHVIKKVEKVFFIPKFQFFFNLELKFTVRDFTYKLNAIAFKHKINDHAIKDVLALLSIALPQPNKCPKTINKLNRKICADMNLKKFGVCAQCKVLEQVEMNHKEQTDCFKCKVRLAYFTTFDVAKQIKSVLSRNDVNIFFALVYH